MGVHGAYVVFALLFHIVPSKSSKIIRIIYCLLHVMLITWRFFETFMRATGGWTAWCVNQQKLGLSDKHSPTYVRNMAGTKKSSTHMGSKRALEVRKA